MRKNAKRFKKIYGITAILLILFLSFVLILKLLSDGFRIERISIANVKIGGLYLKLDKKLILEINHIDLSQVKSSASSQPPNLNDITQIIRYAVSLSSFFQKLELKKIDFDKESYFVHFDGNSFKVNIPYILADFRLENAENDIMLDIRMLKVKQEDLVIKGKILYYEKGDIFAFDLESYINNKKDNVISYQGETDFKYLSVVLDSTKLDSIDILAPYIKMLDLDVYEWMFERADFDSVTINRAYLYTKHFNAKNIDKVINDNLYANGIVQNVRLKFDDNLSEITAPSVVVIFDRGKLSFLTKEAEYEGDSATTKVSRANVELSDFLAPQTLLSINLNLSSTLLDNNILSILRNYDINLPLLQKNGVNSGILAVDILLPTKKFETKASARGNIKIKDSTLEIAGLDLQVDSANITLSEDLVEIDKSSIRFNDILQGEANLKVDTSKKTIALHLLPQIFSIKSGESEIVNLNKIPLTASMDFSNDFYAKITPLDIAINAKNDTISINANIANLLPYVPILTNLDIKNGVINLEIPQARDFVALNARLDKLNYPIYYLNKNRLTSLQIDGVINKDEILLKDNSNKISLKITPQSSEFDLNISDKFIDINEILDSKIPLFADMFSENATTSTQENSSFLIEGDNLHIGLFGYNIPLEEAMLKTTRNGFIANGKNKNGIANIILDNETIQVEANNFNADFINGVFEKDIVSGGTFGVFGIYRNNRFVGDVSIFDTSVKEMAALQNILSFIDAIPSLVVFKLPGFSSSGYEIDEANIRIGLDSEYIALENIDINGSSVDISGNGVVDLKTHDVNIRLELSTIKSLSTILNKIPIIGFLLLGEDGKITTDLTITGTIESPKTEISLLEDAAKTPLNILKRVFSPFQVLIDELQKENQRRRGAR